MNADHAKVGARQPVSEPARSDRARCPRPDLPSLRFEAGRVVRGDLRAPELAHRRPADHPNSLFALHLQAAVKPLAGGVAAGTVVAALIIAAGATTAVWAVITVAAMVIVVGAVDYVRTCE